MNVQFAKSGQVQFTKVDNIFLAIFKLQFTFTAANIFSGCDHYITAT